MLKKRWKAVRRDKTRNDKSSVDRSHHILKANVDNIICRGCFIDKNDNRKKKHVAIRRGVCVARMER